MTVRFLLYVLKAGYMIGRVDLKETDKGLVLQGTPQPLYVTDLTPSIIGVKLEDKKYVGSNGSFQRYTGDCIVILFKSSGDIAEFYCCLPKEKKFTWLSADKLVYLVNKGYTLSNGKVLSSDSGTKYISSINGSYLELERGFSNENDRERVKKDDERERVHRALQGNGVRERAQGSGPVGVRESNASSYQVGSSSVSCRDRINRELRGLNLSINENTPSQEFLDVTLSVKVKNPHGCCVDAHELEDYEGYKRKITFGKEACIAVSQDGDVVNVAKASDSKIKGFVKHGMALAIDNGGTKLDCYNINGGLPISYCRCGFIPVCRVGFVDKFAPKDWDYEALGRPEIVFMAYCGDSADDMYENHGKGYRDFDSYDYEKLPLFTGEDGYDKGWAYRDKLMSEGRLPNAHTKDFKSLTPSPISDGDKKLTDALISITSVPNKLKGLFKRG